jgi:hypothetical protein
MFSKKRFQLVARKQEQRLINEFDGSGCSFDVQKNDADLRCVDRKHTSYFAAVCGGMYLGPQQTGS